MRALFFQLHRSARYLAADQSLRPSRSIAPRIASAGFSAGGACLGIRSDERYELLVTVNAAEASLREIFSGRERANEIEIDDEAVTDLCERIESRSDSFGTVKKWIKRGNAFDSGVLSAVYSRLMERKRYTEIMKLLEGVRSEELADFTDKHCLWAIGVIARRRGMAKAEIFYDSLPENLKTDEVRIGLVVNAAKENKLSKAEEWLQRIELVTTDVLDVMMVLYLNRDRHGKVVEIFEMMTSLGLRPGARTYLMLLQCKDRTGALDGIERESLRAVQKIDVENASTALLNDAMEVYGYLKQRSGIEEIWRSMRKKDDLDESSYFSAMTGFGLAGDVARARKAFKELLAGADEQTEFDRNPYGLMLDVYACNGMMQRAEKIWQAGVLEDDSFAAYNSMIQGYIASNRVTEALETLRSGISILPAKNIRVEYKTMMALLPIYADQADLRSAKVLMEYYKNRGDAAVYRELLRVYKVCNGNSKEVRERMRANGVEGDEQTEELLESLDMSPAAVFKKQMKQQETRV